MSTAFVVGGGISGLAACHYLLKSAKFSKVIVLEASSRVGGWVHSVRHDDGSVFELGPRSIRPVGLPGFNTLCLTEDLGLQNDALAVTRKSPAAKNRFIYVNNKLNILPTSPFKSSSLLGKPLLLSVLKEMFKPSGQGDDESIYDFVHRRFSVQFADYIIDPVCRGIFAGNCRELSMLSCFPDMFIGERNHGSLIKAFLKKSRVKYKKKSMLATRAKQEQWTAYSFKKGIQQIVDALETTASQRREVELLKDTPCSALEWKDGKFLVNVNGDSVTADHIFSSVFANDLSGLLPPEHKQLSQELMRIPAVTAVVVVIELDGHIELPTPGFGHLLPSFEDGKMLGVIYDSCTFPQHDRPDKPSTRFTVMMGGAWYEELQSSVKSMTEEELGAMAVDALFTQLGIRGSISKLQVSINKDCIPQYLVGHNKKLDNIFSYIRDNKLPLSLIGSSYEGVSVNDCIYNARLAVEAVTGTELL